MNYPTLQSISKSIEERIACKIFKELAKSKNWGNYKNIKLGSQWDDLKHKDIINLPKEISLDGSVDYKMDTGKNRIWISNEVLNTIETCCTIFRDDNIFYVYKTEKINNNRDRFENENSNNGEPGCAVDKEWIKKNSFIKIPLTECGIKALLGLIKIPEEID